MKKTAAGLSLMSFLLVSCGGTTAPTTDMDTEMEGADTMMMEQPEEFVVGWVGPLSGDIAAIGNGSKSAVEMAIAELNEAGGINGVPVRGVFEDGACESRKASTAGNKLINIDKVNMIVGGICSSESLALVPMAERAGITMISPASSSPELTGISDFFLRVTPSDVFQGQFAAEFIANELGVKQVGLLYAVTDYTKGLADAFKASFEALEGEILLEDTFQQKSRDLRSQITKMKDAGVELVYFATYTEAGVPGLKQMMELELDAQIVGPEAFADPKLMEAEGAEGVLYSIPVTSDDTAFAEKYMAFTEAEELPAFAMQSYDAMMTFAMALTEMGDAVDMAALPMTLREMEAYEGVSGTIEFDGNGDIETAAYEMVQIKDQASVPYEPQE